MDSALYNQIDPYEHDKSCSWVNFGKQVAQVRYKMDMNQTEFAKHIGVTRTKLSLIETGKRFPNRTEYLGLVGLRKWA